MKCYECRYARESSVNKKTLECNVLKEYRNFYYVESERECKFEIMNNIYKEIKNKRRK